MHQNRLREIIPGRGDRVDDKTDRGEAPSESRRNYASADAAVGAARETSPRTCSTERLDTPPAFRTPAFL